MKLIEGLLVGMKWCAHQMKPLFETCASPIRVPVPILLTLLQFSFLLMHLGSTSG